MKLSFERIWTDDDQVIQVAVIASQGTQIGAMEGYVYPEDLMSFGERLREFPSSVDHEADLEAGGDDPECVGHFRLRAFVTKPGEVALEVLMTRHGDPPHCSSSHLYLQTEAAILNRLGSALAAWDHHVEASLGFADANA